MIRLPRWAYAAVGLVALSTVVLLLTSAAGAIALHPTVRHITINASQFQYEPSTITVNQGDDVRIQLISTDVTHGFYLDSYNVQTAAIPGQPSTLEFIADRVGTFRFRCSHTCGPLHPFMIGELTITPVSRANPGPFLGSAVLAALLGIGTVVWTWRSTTRPEVTHA
ncbi:MAG TPA: cupredoxin domain-containing protein [Chloroflexota bacterium]|nr:cupredoxin domain-containing protein [Chloroflexota bacterium]